MARGLAALARPSAGATTSSAGPTADLASLVTSARPSKGEPELILVVEVQLSIDETKRRVWPQYTAAAFGRRGCPVLLVVVTPSTKVERWARRSIRVGPGHVMRPLVVGPGALPLLSRAEIRQSPILGMLSTLAHLEDSRAAVQALETLEAFATWPEDPDGRLADILQAALPVALRTRMEELMRASKYEYQSDFAKRYFARGREEGREEGHEVGLVEGQARALPLFLRSRGVDVGDEARARIEGERDPVRLETWIRRAASATTVDDG